MSKIAGINLGNPNESFQIFGSQLGGRDAAITVQRPTANIKREQVDELTKQLNIYIKEISTNIESLEVMKEMMTMDDDTDSIILDKEFVNEYSQRIENLKSKFEQMLKAANNK
jgi:hypothetical protein